MEDLFPYQLEGAGFLQHRKTALLADEMGLGKSAQVVTACDFIEAESVLVLCPAVARINWQREFEKFSRRGWNFWVILGAQEVRVSGIRSAPGRPGPFVTICSYDLAEKVAHLLPDRVDVLVLDESHYLKSLEAKRTHAVLGREGLVRRAKRVWALSGTPAPNHPGELWALLYTFGYTQLPYTTFVEKFCTFYYGPHGIQITGAKKAAIPELRGILSKLMLRRKKEEVMKELPPITFEDIVVEPGTFDPLETVAFGHYVVPTDTTPALHAKLQTEKATLAGMLSLVSPGRKDGIKALEAMAKSLSTLRMYTGMQKVEPVAELVKNELTTGAYQKIVLFCIHRDVIEGLRTRLKDFGPVTLYGGTDPEKRQRNVDKFQKHEKCQVFIGNIQAAGTAITLTAAHQVMFVEQSWTPGDNAQAAMRCHRIGQTQPVTVRVVGLADSIDEKISAVLRRKMKDLIAIFDERGLQTETVSDTEGTQLNDSSTAQGEGVTA